LEIRSENQSPEDLRGKMRIYRANRTMIAILIDPDERTVKANRPERGPETHRGPEAVRLDTALPGFVRDLGLSFEASGAAHRGLLQRWLVKVG
jgi:Uma2 family endonuclease